MRYEGILQVDIPALVADAQLDLLRQGDQLSYPGYPDFAQRLVMHPDNLQHDATGRLVLPEGPWQVDAHGNSPDAEIAPSLVRQQELLSQGYVLDAMGRPLHPWLLKMVADPTIGIVTGKGYYREWGANPTVDAVVVKNGYVLMVRRGDTGELALPGGFRDGRETNVEAAKREVAEETGLVVPDDAVILPFYEGPVVDRRATAHAWPETASFVIRLDDEGPLPEVVGADDACEALWMPITALQDEQLALFGAHRYLLHRAFGNVSLGIPEAVDLSTDDWTERLAAASIYRKVGTVWARPAIPGEVIRSVLADGTVETENTAGENQLVITGARGEEYIIGAEKFAARYAASAVVGLFRATGTIRAVDNPTGRAMVITAPWGEQQFGAADCKIASLYDPANPDFINPDRYIIGAEEFAETYALREEA